MTAIERSLNIHVLTTAIATIGTGAVFAWLQPDTFATQAAIIIATTGVTALSTYAIHNRLQRNSNLERAPTITTLGLRYLRSLCPQTAPTYDLVTTLFRAGGIQKPNGDIVITAHTQLVLYEQLIEKIPSELFPTKNEDGDLIFSKATQQLWDRILHQNAT